MFNVLRSFVESVIPTLPRSLCTLTIVSQGTWCVESVGINEWSNERERERERERESTYRDSKRGGHVKTHSLLSHRLARRNKDDSKRCSHETPRDVRSLGLAVRDSLPLQRTSIMKQGQHLATLTIPQIYRTLHTLACKLDCCLVYLCLCSSAKRELSIHHNKVTSERCEWCYSNLSHIIEIWKKMIEILALRARTPRTSFWLLSSEEFCVLVPVFKREARVEFS